LPSGATAPGSTGHTFSVQMASLFLPLPGHTHVLQPSAAVHNRCGQHWSSSIGLTGSCCFGRTGHCKLVQLASLLEPLRGHMQVFRPSPAGKATPGKQCPAGRAGAAKFEQSMRVHFASLLLPLAGHVQVLQPSEEVNNMCGQQSPSEIGARKSPCAAHGAQIRANCSAIT